MLPFVATGKMIEQMLAEERATGRAAVLKDQLEQISDWMQPAENNPFTAPPEWLQHTVDAFESSFKTWLVGRCKKHVMMKHWKETLDVVELQLRLLQNMRDTKTSRRGPVLATPSNLRRLGGAPLLVTLSSSMSIVAKTAQPC